MLGISIYAGLDLSLEDNLEYLNKAAELGIKNLFFSLNIPEVKESFSKEAVILLESRSTKPGGSPRPGSSS